MVTIIPSLSSFIISSTFVVHPIIYLCGYHDTIENPDCNKLILNQIMNNYVFPSFYSCIRRAFFSLIFLLASKMHIFACFTNSDHCPLSTSFSRCMKPFITTILPLRFWKFILPLDDCMLIYFLLSANTNSIGSRFGE